MQRAEEPSKAARGWALKRRVAFLRKLASTCSAHSLRLHLYPRYRARER